MPSEDRISVMMTALTDVVKQSGAAEFTSIYPNALVVDGTPAALPSGYILVQDMAGHYVPALKVAGVVYATADRVNLLYVRGTEPIAFQQGSASPSTNLQLSGYKQIFQHMGA